jgi:hypothetical protein
MPVLPDGQYGPVFEAHQCELGYALERLWSAVGVCRFQRRGCCVLVLAMSCAEGQEGQEELNDWVDDQRFTRVAPYLSLFETVL